MIGRVRLLMRLCAFKLFNLASPRQRRLSGLRHSQSIRLSPNVSLTGGCSQAPILCPLEVLRVDAKGGEGKEDDNSNEPQAVCLFFQVRFMLALPPSRSSKNL